MCSPDELPQHGLACLLVGRTGQQVERLNAAAWLARPDRALSCSARRRNKGRKGAQLRLRPAHSSGQRGRYSRTALPHAQADILMGRILPSGWLGCFSFCYIAIARSTISVAHAIGAQIDVAGCANFFLAEVSLI